jgi:hypothetical protein
MKPTTEELMAWIKDQITHIHRWGNFDPYTDEITNEKMLKAIRSIVAEHDGLTEKVGRLEAQIAYAKKLFKFLDDDSWDAALAETEGEK